MKALFPIVFLFLVGCSDVPVAIKEAPQPDWQLGQVSQQPAQHEGQAIRWGGQIVKVENSDARSVLHVVQFPLNSYGRPDIDRRSQGRFLAQTSQFIDPYIYKSGTLITVAGIVSGDKTITIDKKTMTIPVVTIGETYRWMSQRYNDDRYWHGYPYYYDRFGYGLSYPHWRSRWYYGRGYYW